MKIYKIIISVLLVTVISLIFWNQNTALKSAIRIKQQEEIIAFYDLNERINRMYAGISIENIRIKQDTMRTIKIMDLKAEMPMLIFNAIDTDCSSCMENEIKGIYNDFKDDKNFKPVILITPVVYSYMKSLFSIMEKSGFQIYQTSFKSFDWPLQYFGPYYFLLNSDTTISDICIINGNTQELNSMYRSRIANELKEIN